MANGPIITAARLREVLLYNPETGDFIWQVRGPGRSKIVGGLHVKGYVRLSVDYVEYLAHDLAWLYMTGEWATYRIDHINTKRNDNRWVNLRLGSPAENAGNKGIMRTNTNGHTGTYQRKPGGPWVAHFRNRHLGTFSTQEEAHEAYAKAVRNHYGEFVHERFKMSD